MLARLPGRLLARLLVLALTLLAASFLVFGAIRLLPGDPARLLAGPQARAAAVAALHHQLGLDRPFLRQYGDFLLGAVHGRLGTSTVSHQPVGRELAAHAPYTIALGLLAYLLASTGGVLFGCLAAINQARLFDRLFGACTNLLVSVADFWFGLMAMELFAVRLGWLPLMGTGSPAHIVLPAITLALMPAGLIGRMTRAGMIDVLRQDYIRTATAKGLAPLAIYGRHALRNALVPIVTIVGLNLGSVIGGAVVTETLFAWPGLGALLVEAVKYRDYPVIQGVALVAVTAVVVMNLLAELAIALLDPRLRQA